MGEPEARESDEELCLLSHQSNGDRSWRLNFDGFQLSPEHKDKKPPRSLHDCLGVSGPEDNVAEYYQQQVEMLEGFNEMDALAERGFIPGMSKEEREKLARSETLAIRISNIANMVLFAAKVYASVRSGSLAIIASTLDSLLDLLSGFILWFTAFSMSTPNPYQYPIGKKRMQPLGILVFASVMATLGLQIILESVQTMISDVSQLDYALKFPSPFNRSFIILEDDCLCLWNDSDIFLCFAQEDEFNLTKEQERWVVVIMLGVTVVKLLLVFYCRTFTNEIVKAYAQDHFFDVITNIIGLVAALLANYIDDWIDPVGAIILALYTIRTWSMTVLENVNSLVGRSAAPEYLQKLTYLCWNHHKAIRHIDTVRAYTFGSHYFVEVDIVLPANMPLQEAHDIGESLQEKLELLPEIERAFVHLDYEYTHKPEHAQAHAL
ncbi:Cation efflux protein - like 2 [Theobroma cacao]|nr:Cation efflux protein - like 2 [Theobroma cacao]